MTYIVTIKFAVEADDLSDAVGQAEFAGSMLVPLATGALPGHRPVAVGITRAKAVEDTQRLNRSLGRTTDPLNKVLGRGGEG